MAAKTLQEVLEMTEQEINEMSGTGVLMAIFSNGKHGRKVELSEMKAFSKDERDAFVAECRENFIENCKA